MDVGLLNLDKILLFEETHSTRRFLKAILEHLPNAIYVKDAKTLKYIFVNSAVEKISGYKKEDLIGNTNYEIFAKDLADYYTAYDNLLLKERKTIEISEELHKTKNNSFKIFKTQKILISNDNNEPLYILDISDDITEIIRTERELKETELRFLKLFQTSPIGICVISANDNKLIDMNNSFLNLLMFEPDELLNKNFEDVPIWDEPNEIKIYMLDAIAEGTVKNKEVRMKTKYGNSKTVLLSIAHVETEEEAPWLILMILDISEQKAAADEIRKSLEMEKDLNILKTRFISMISHEFRTPLTTIMLSTDLLRRYSSNLKENDKIVHYDRIQNTVLALTQLMENVLTIGRLEAGKFDLNIESLDLPSLCKSVAENIEFSNNSDVSIKFLYKGGCINANLDENLVRLIITNLLGNAVKYSPKGNIVLFELYSENGFVIFKISDKGIGIPENELENLFKTFYRGSNTGNIAGYGLGLAIVKKCVDAHKGTIEVHSEINNGTIFTVRLPMN